MRIGAVNYLNSKPLVQGLDRLAPDVQLCFDLPSRLADSLSAGRLDVALIPSVEFFRGPGYAIVSDACVACRGPVLSVKLYFRVPPAEVRRVALDDGSRTSAALTQILLAEMCGVQPEWEPLPIGRGLESTDADAVLLIGDRAIRSEGRVARSEEREPGTHEVPSPGSTELAEVQPPAPNPFHDVWDLGDRWTRWTGLPFVFAMWVARESTDLAEMAAILSAARDEGVRQLAQIAAREAAALPIPVELARRYLRENLHFTLGRKEREGLRRFYQLCVAHGLAPGGLERTLGNVWHDCPTR